MSYALPPNLSMSRYLSVDRMMIKHGKFYVEELYRTVESFPDSAMVSLDTPASLKKILESNINVFDKNRRIWGDVAHFLHAYITLVVYRADQLILSILADLQSDRLVPAAANARNLIELVVVASQEISIVASALQNACNNKLVHKHIVEYEDVIEKIMLRSIWGAKSRDIVEALRPRDAFKTIKSLDAALKGTNQEAFYHDLYEYLSEFVHPYRNGFSALIAGSWDDAADFRRNLVISKKNDSNAAAVCVGRTVSAMCVTSYSLCYYWSKKRDAIHSYRAIFRQQ
ncbi:hypothetical protein [Geminicoccus roseus]|uniref:hypothetical protein n=1 Tax=Geminicoccus roseus TaxID=404900 RepID=UPI0012F80FBB|nr:hypothetical protein [Geminicoccus roseus]